MTAAVKAHIGGEPQTYVSSIAPHGRARRVRMRFVTTRGQAPATSLEWALFDGLAPDGGLYVPESIDPWTPRSSTRCRR